MIFFNKSVGIKKNLAAIWVLSLSLCFPFSLASESLGLDNFYKSASHCLRNRHSEICRLSLIRAEVIQRYAESQRKYSCQTALLGLESDLTISYLKLGQISSEEEMMKGIDMAQKPISMSR